MTAPQLSVDTVNKSASNNNISQISETVKENSNKGSSPRVWGQEERQYIANDVLGIIPTRVGTRKDTKFVAGKT